jgi:cytochrome c biogenesis factor
MRHGKWSRVLAKLFYKQLQQPAPVAIRHLASDLYVVLARTRAGFATFDVFLTPLVSWLWLGA